MSPTCMRVAVVTLGGDRRHAMEQQFHHLQQQHGLNFDVRYVDGIDATQLKKRDYLQDSTIDVDAFYRCVKYLDGNGLGELACLLAHVRVHQSLTADDDGLLILEDSVRFVPSTAAMLERVLHATRTATAAMAYAGFLGREEHLTTVYNQHILPAAALGESLCDLPVGKDPHTEKAFDLIWGAFAYSITSAAAKLFLDTLRADLGAFIFARRGKPSQVKPIDKILPRILLANNQRVVIPTQVCFFRAPKLTSMIHQKYDTKFASASSHLLALHGRTWSDVWLRPEERQSVDENPYTANNVPTNQ